MSILLQREEDVADRPSAPLLKEEVDTSEGPTMEPDWFNAGKGDIFTLNFS